MKVYSNTTPLISLSAIGRLDLLPNLFSRIWITRSVEAECALGGPIPVPKLARLPWIETTPDPVKPHPALWMLDAGEATTLTAALAEGADLVLIDERIGRNQAEFLGLSVRGSLGILAEAKRRALIPSFTDAASAMRSAGIHFHPNLVQKIAAALQEA